MSLTSSGDIGAPWSTVDERAEEDLDELGVETGREIEIGWPGHGASEKGYNVVVFPVLTQCQRDMDLADESEIRCIGPLRRQEFM
jgi:hypothetical protein